MEPQGLHLFPKGCTYILYCPCQTLAKHPLGLKPREVFIFLVPFMVGTPLVGNKAEELEKLVINRKIKLGDSLEIIGSHMNTYKDKHTALEIKVSQFEQIDNDTNLFGGEVK